MGGDHVSELPIGELKRFVEEQCELFTSQDDTFIAVDALGTGTKACIPLDIQNRTSPFWLAAGAAGVSPESSNNRKWAQWLRAKASQEGKGVRAMAWLGTFSGSPECYLHPHTRIGDIIRVAENSVTAIRNGTNP